MLVAPLVLHRLGRVSPDSIWEGGGNILMMCTHVHVYRALTKHCFTSNIFWEITNIKSYYLLNACNSQWCLQCFHLPSWFSSSLTVSHICKLKTLHWWDVSLIYETFFKKLAGLDTKETIFTQFKQLDRVWSICLHGQIVTQIVSGVYNVNPGIINMQCVTSLHFSSKSSKAC